ncbi:hypothetical protein ACKVE0_02895 [Acinetobacter albensis]|uniref:Uncharacterized protein n=1 Tax=Acinetobacter albensis TaxID=1673609 RepID=A0ABW9JRG4_9GAMM
MKLTQILLASTFAFATATTFAATAEQKTQEKVVVSTQEQPETNLGSAAGQPSSNQPASEAAAQEAPAPSAAQ